MPRYLKFVLWLISGLVLLCLAVVIAISIMNWNWIKPWANGQLSDVAQREVQIEGDVRLDWQRHDGDGGWRSLIPWPYIQVHDVVVANPAWATTGPEMVRAQTVYFLLDITGLTENVVRFAGLEIHDGHLNLERRQDGVNNWTFGDDKPDDGGSEWRVELGSLMLHQASLRVLDASRELDVVLTGNTPDMSGTEASFDNEHYGTQWTVEGHYQGAAVSGEGQMGHVLALQSDTTQFPVRGVLHVGDTSLRAEGTITRPRDLAALDANLELSGPTMADLYPILGVALPHTPPYQTAGRLVGELDGELDTWIYENFTGTVGNSDLAGTLQYQRQDPRPVLSGHLQSDLLRFEDLGPLVGAPTSDEIADDDALARQQPDDKALPVESANSTIWSVMDADVTFEGKRIESNADLPLDDVKAHVFLDDSILRFEPLDFGVAGGTLESTIRLDGNKTPISASLDAEARDLQLGKLFPGVESMDAALGAVHGTASLTGTGNSVSALMAGASGELSAVVSRGTVSRFLLEAAGLNVANMVFVKLFGDEQVVLQCLAAEFQIDDGLMNTRTFILETEDAVVTIEGQINLATEEMNLDIHPDNKSLRIFTLRSPLYVAGTFKEPDIGVQKGPVAAKAGAAVALGVVATPLAALLPLLNVGTDDETTCTTVSGAEGGVPVQPDADGRLKGSVPGVDP